MSIGRNGDEAGRAIGIDRGSQGQGTSFRSQRIHSVRTRKRRRRRSAEWVLSERSNAYRSRRASLRLVHLAEEGSLHQLYRAKLAAAQVGARHEVVVALIARILEEWNAALVALRARQRSERDAEQVAGRARPSRRSVLKRRILPPGPL
jgi:hypothetical protein